MALEIDRGNLRQGLLGLVVAIVEIIRDALRAEALRRVEGGRLRDEECERLEQALNDLDEAIESIKMEYGLGEAVRSVREGLDDAVDRAVKALIPECVTSAVSRKAARGRAFVPTG